ncbi:MULTISPECIES: DUF443 family protein [unclassified Lactococcus]|uniref:DUF443 family protein n=1 Tax=unclassified Lactococcus TaxID=2643510 RepID=UPI0011CA86CF|nr:MULTISPECIES: DUF443 family protein [unclassified Lactococcus]MQW23152.1 hypothetical protein [Lactococcus sp. dk101]TXK44204.1 DUF443 domain-containing protein [Lactococcus sp. dk310]TXK49935.1 DUF443 domain-containing protein [Lactococcus sp. dk322]
MKKYINIEAKPLSDKKGIHILTIDGEYYLINMFTHYLAMFIPLLGYQFKYKLYKISESELIKILHQYGGYRDISNPNSLRKKSKGKNGFQIGGLGMFLANTIGKEMLKSAYPSYLALIFLTMASLFILIGFFYENIQLGKIAPFTYNSVDFVTVKLADTVKHSVYKLTFAWGGLVIITFFGVVAAIVSQNIIVDGGALFFLFVTLSVSQSISQGVYDITFLESKQ